jgi:hypothetical protein
MQQVSTGELRQVESVEISGPCEMKITRFGVRSGKLGDVEVVWGTTELFGNNAMFVATRNPQGDRFIRVATLPKQKNPVQ